MLFDINAPGIVDDPRCDVVVGSLSDVGCVESAFRLPIDIVFHLASVPGGLAEQEYETGRAVNLDGTLNLLEGARRQARPPRFVFASSVAALGGPLNDSVDDNTPLRPVLTYGAHKQIGEILVSDFSRRGWIDGIALRLPGIVARPPLNTGQLSAFMSDIIRTLAAGEEYVCPVSPHATMWLMSIPRLVDNLLHAAALSPDLAEQGQALTLPALHLAIGQLVNAVAAQFGSHIKSLVSYQPQRALEEKFGRYPMLFTSVADRLGFAHDGDARALVLNALALDARASKSAGNGGAA